MLAAPHTDRGPGIITRCSAGDWEERRPARRFDEAGSDAAFALHRTHAHPDVEVTAVRTRRYALTLALTIINIAAIVIGGGALALLRNGADTDLYWLVIVFPTVAALVTIPVIWVAVLIVAIVISVVYASLQAVDTAWWPRFYQALAWCGVGSLALGWAIAAGFVILASVTHVS
ncbi:hypothetical protein [Microbacterium sp. SORGH_AS_0888]|uniref:hypothetical protein n=1 Tax=Microbacterium sp. SORGH_AS_0888 TaxID=3041791 RepID=UPI00277F14A8|nr:hypothetical protein [Microbacterium sp. SORGH_AS_0888]MDQ1130114.1 hypothetical protein [Microbacterium sp. SORGH_AS_0888]